MPGDNPNRLLDLLKTGEDSDVTFIVGEQKEEIEGHRMILKAYCGSFKTMFKEQPKLDRVEIPDADPIYFKKFLEIVYNSGSEAASLAADDVIPLLNLAKRYDAQHVTKLCSKKLETALTESSALKIFQQAILYKDKALEEAATKLICKEARKLIDSPEFLKLPAEHICKLLSLDEFRAESELQILRSCIRWAKEECKRQKTIDNPKYMRSVLEKVIPLIRFSQLNASDFAAAVLKHRILTTEEIQEIYLYRDVLPAKWQAIPPGLFNPSPRKYYKQPAVSQIIKRLDTKVQANCQNFGCCVYPHQHIPGIANSWHRISFRCNAVAKLVSIGINEECPYSAAGNRQATVKVGKENGQGDLGSKTGQINKNIKKPFQLKFDKPVNLEANTWYTLSAIVHEPYLGVNYTIDQFVQCTDDGVVLTQDSRGNSVKFEFKNAALAGAPQTTVSGGQMAEIEFLVD